MSRYHRFKTPKRIKTQEGLFDDESLSFLEESSRGGNERKLHCTCQLGNEGSTEQLLQGFSEPGSNSFRERVNRDL